MPPKLTLAAITLGCADPPALAAFYREATGWRPHPKSDGEFAGLTRDDRLFLGFQRVDAYRPPRWPDQTVPQQSHLDFAVDEFDAAEVFLVGPGAAKPSFQPDAERFRVQLDPAGHPFCLVRR